MHPDVVIHDWPNPYSGRRFRCLVTAQVQLRFQQRYREDISFPLVFIDGITRCGKSSLSGILPSLTNMEHIQFSTILELVVPGLFLQKLDTDYAKSITRIYLNELSYNLTLGGM